MRKTLLVLVLLATMTIIPAFAQTDDNPLLRMLARIADSAPAREYLTYIDYAALLATRPGAPEVHSFEDFQKVTSERDSQGAAVMGAFYGMTSGPQLFQYAFSAGEAIPTTMGFDLFGVERAAEFGSPPNNVVILEGDIDPDAVIAAHEARGYTPDDTNGLTLLCSAEGCDAGTKANLSNIDPSNLFGGELGRSQPVLIDNNVVVSSPTIGAVEVTASTIAGETNSLADNPDYRAAAEAITANGTLIQSYFISPQNILPASSIALDPRLSPEQIKATLSAVGSDFVPVPQYNLVVIADSATETEQQALVALVYSDEADAEAAAALFPEHLQAYESLMTQRNFGEMLEDRGVTAIDTSVYSASTERSVLLLTLHAPLPSNEISGDSSQPQASSLVYSLLARAYISRDINWLATTP